MPITGKRRAVGADPSQGYQVQGEDPAPDPSLDPAESASPAAYAAPVPPSPDFSQRFNADQMSSPTARKVFQPEINDQQQRERQESVQTNRTATQLAQQQKLLDSQAKKQANDQKEQQYRSSGQKFYTDANGDIQPEIDDLTGKPAFEEKTGPVTYDDAGTPSQKIQDKTGTVKTINPDKDAPVGGNPDDPTDKFIYRQNKNQAWEPIDPEEGITSTDPKIKIASAKTLHARATQDLEKQDSDLQANIAQTQLDGGDKAFRELQKDGARTLLEDAITSNSTPIPRPAPKASWFGTTPQDDPAAITAWNEQETQRKTILSDAQAKIKAADDYKALVQQQIALKQKMQETKDAGVGEFLKNKLAEIAQKKSVLEVAQPDIAQPDVAGTSAVSLQVSPEEAQNQAGLRLGDTGALDVGSPEIPQEALQQAQSIPELAPLAQSYQEAQTKRDNLLSAASNEPDPVLRKSMQQNAVEDFSQVHQTIGAQWDQINQKISDPVYQAGKQADQFVMDRDTAATERHFGHYFSGSSISDAVDRTKQIGEDFVDKNVKNEKGVLGNAAVGLDSVTAFAGNAVNMAMGVTTEDLQKSQKADTAYQWVGNLDAKGAATALLKTQEYNKRLSDGTDLVKPVEFEGGNPFTDRDNNGLTLENLQFIYNGLKNGTAGRADVFGPTFMEALTTFKAFNANIDDKDPDQLAKRNALRSGILQTIQEKYPNTQLAAQVAGSLSQFVVANMLGEFAVGAPLAASKTALLARYAEPAGKLAGYTGVGAAQSLSQTDRPMSFLDRAMDIGFQTTTLALTEELGDHAGEKISSALAPRSSVLNLAARTAGNVIGGQVGEMTSDALQAGAQGQSYSDQLYSSFFGNGGVALGFGLLGLKHNLPHHLQMKADNGASKALSFTLPQIQQEMVGRIADTHSFFNAVSSGSQIASGIADLLPADFQTNFSGAIDREQKTGQEYIAKYSEILNDPNKEDWEKLEARQHLFANATALGQIANQAQDQIIQTAAAYQEIQGIKRDTPDATLRVQSAIAGALKLSSGKFVTPAEQAAMLTVNVDSATDAKGKPVPIAAQKGGQVQLTPEGVLRLKSVAPQSYALYESNLQALAKKPSKTSKTETKAPESAPEPVETAPKAADPETITPTPAVPDATKSPSPPALNSWTARGQKGTEVSLPGVEASGYHDAERKLAGKLPAGEMLDADSVKFAKDVAIPSTEPIVPHGTISHGQALQDATKEALEKFPENREKRQRTIDAVAPHLDAYGSLFPGGVKYTRLTRGGGMAYNAKTKALEIDLGRVTRQLDGVKNPGALVQATLREELIHRAATDVLTKEEVENLWALLPKDLKQKTRDAYWQDRTQTNEALPDDDAFAMGHEFLRILTQDSFFKQVTESTEVDPGLVAVLRELLEKIGKHLRDMLADPSITDAATRKAVENAEALIVKRLEELGLKKEVSEPPAPPSGLKDDSAVQSPAGRSPPASNAGGSLPGTERGDGVAPVSGEKLPDRGTAPLPVAPGPTIADHAEKTSKKLPPARLVELGNVGTAYTDNNDAVEYRWALAELDDMVISNSEHGLINPDYPQELQPRDRSTAGSQAQVDDIAKNANFDRLSFSESVGNGAPIIGPEDGVAESGNGRLMGLRRAYGNKLPSIKAYKAKLESDASKFGLDGSKVAAMKKPVLVRVRQTALDRKKFAEVANVSNVAPMREMEIAKKDAGNLSPDLFALFKPSEDGNIFTSGNQEFIRAFVKNVVPQSERPAIIDSRGNLSQNGLRRVRNALFVAAYGDSPEAMSALGRMAEDIESDGKNITNAMIAAAPAFAQENARIKSGALHPLGITDDVVGAVQALLEVRARGEKVSDYLDQGQLIKDNVTPFQKEIMQFLDRNGRSSKRIFETLSRYSMALDHAGDPRQGDLLAMDAPTKEGLWNLAQRPPVAATVLGAGERATAIPKYLRIYNRLFGMQKAGTKFSDSQRALFEKAERELGQTMMFAGEGFYSGPQGTNEKVGAFDDQDSQGRLFSGQRTLQELSEHPIGSMEATDEAGRLHAAERARADADLRGIDRRAIDYYLDVENKAGRFIEKLANKDLSRFFRKADADVVVLIKPLALELGRRHQIEEFIQKQGGKIADEWRGVVNVQRMEEHYAEHKDKAFFPTVTGYYAGKEVVALRVRVNSAHIKEMRTLLGGPAVEPGTFRHDMVGGWNHLVREKTNGLDNGVHLSDSSQAGERESQLWFSKEAKALKVDPGIALREQIEELADYQRLKNNRSTTQNGTQIGADTTSTTQPLNPSGAGDEGGEGGGSGRFNGGNPDNSRQASSQSSSVIPDNTNGAENGKPEINPTEENTLAAGKRANTQQMGLFDILTPDQQTEVAARGTDLFGNPLTESATSRVVQSGASHDTSTPGNLERNSPAGKPGERSSEGELFDDRSAGGNDAGKVGESGGVGRDAGRVDSSPADSFAAADGEKGNLDLFEQFGSTERTAPSTAGGKQPERSSPADDARILFESRADTSVGAVAPVRPGDDAVAKRRVIGANALLVQQKVAEKIPVKSGDLENIRATLPYLLPEAHVDVQKAERRLVEKGQKGILFTNGTGTGKTYVGLGIVKRMVKQGKKNILIVTPTFKKTVDWVKDGKNLGLTVTALEGLQDAGKGIVATTYANFRSNEALMGRDFDAVVYDESHKLMQNENGSGTSAYSRHREITFHPDTAFRTMAERMIGKYPIYPGKDASEQDQDEYRAQETAWHAEETARRPEIEAAAQTRIKNTKAIFLSATPFAYHKNLGYADGYLFESPKNDGNQGYNVAQGFDRFLQENFGYHMRTGKLNQPEAGVNVDFMEREFADRLMREGAVSGRAIDVPYDYSREFVLLDPGVGKELDRGIQVLLGWDDRDTNDWKHLPEFVRKQWDYSYMQGLLESLKMAQSIDRLNQHLAMDRKVILFHSYINNNPRHPFQGWVDQAPNAETRQEAVEFESRYPDLVNLDLGRLMNPLRLVADEFGDKAAFFNGTVSVGRRLKAADDFNDDAGKVKILVAQMESAKEGISLHDTTGKHQRVVYNVALPTKPTDAIQTEGRGYRVGLKSNAVFEYGVIHTSTEKYTFGSKINQRVRTAENLAMGSQARALQDAFKQGYLNPVSAAPSVNQGKGGKAGDRMQAIASPFEVAKSYYFGRQKKTSRNKSAEGTDYFATPEPVGAKMVEWLGLKANDDAMEPSAGHGAIARFFPDFTKNTFIEPSHVLADELRIKIERGNTLVQQFEDLDLVNKFDGIAMNPPFGAAGRTAIDHLEKAARHLRDGGRIVALIPDGPSANAKFEKWMEGETAKNVFKVLEIKLPSVTFERAGTAVKTRIVILDKQLSEAGQNATQDRGTRDINVETINELFDRLENMEVPAQFDPDTPLSAGERARSEEPAEQTQLDFRDASKAPGDLVRENLGLATTVASDYFGMPGVQNDDVIQHARIGLIKAAKAYPTQPRAMKFGSYAGRSIRNELNSLYHVQKRVNDNEIKTTDEPLSEDGTTLQDITPDTNSDKTLPVEREETDEILSDLLATLSPRVREIVQKFSSGMNGEEIATELGVSRQAVNNTLRTVLSMMKKRLNERGFEGQEEGILFTGQKSDGDSLEDLFAEMNQDLPSQADVDEMRKWAAVEPIGSRTIGQPQKANYAQDDATRVGINVVQDMREDARKREEESGWINEARQRVETNKDAAKRTILEKALNPAKFGTFTAVDVKTAQLLVPQLMREAYQTGDKTKQREAFALAWAYDAGGSDQARAFAARRDPFKTPKERHLEFLTKIVSTPTKEQRAWIEKAPTQAEKSTRLEQAQMERLEKIEKALAGMGVKLEDIFAGEASVVLKSAPLVQNALKTFNKASEREIIRLTLDGFSDKEIAKKSNLAIKDVQSVQNRMDEILAARLGEFADRGFTAADLEALDITKLFAGERPGDDVRKVVLTPERKAAIIADMLRKIRPDRELRNSNKMTKRRKPRRRDPMLPYDGPTPSDSPVAPTGDQKQDVLVYGQKALEPAAQAEFNRNRKPSDSPVPFDKLKKERDLYESEQPWEYTPFDLDNKDQVLRASRLMQAADSNAFDMVYEAWVMSILSGPQTHATNILGNAGMAGWEYFAQRPIEAIVNLGLNEKDATSFGELQHVYRGIIPGIMNGWQAGIRAFKAENDFFENDKLNQQFEFSDFDKGGGNPAAIPGTVGSVVRIPGRALLFMDSFFKYMSGQMEVGGQAYRLGKAQGLEGEALQNFIRGEVNLPGSMSWQRAVSKAKDLTFQTEMPEMMKKVARIRSTRSYTSFGGRLMGLFLGMNFPFIKTPYNIFRVGIRKSPLGSLNVLNHIGQGFYSLKNGGPFVEGYSKAQMVQDIAEQAIAWATTLLLLGAIEGDGDDDDKKVLLITGSRPSGVNRQGEADALKRTYGGQYEIRIGGRSGVSFNYGKMEPFATVLGIIADGVRIGKQNEAKEFPDKMLANLMAQSEQKTFLQGWSNITDAMDQMKSGGASGVASRYLQRQFLSGLIPNLIRQPIRNWDDVVRDSKNAGPGYQLTGIPSLAEPRFDLYGQPQKKDGFSLARIFYPGGQQVSPEMQAGDRLLVNWNEKHKDEAYWPERPNADFYRFKKANGTYVAMTPGQIAVFDKLAGQAFQQKLRSWLTSMKSNSPTKADLKSFKEDLEKARHETKETMALRVEIGSL